MSKPKMFFEKNCLVSKQNIFVLSRKKICQHFAPVNIVLKCQKLQLIFLLQIVELSVKSPCLHPVFGPSPQWYSKSKEILSKSLLIIVVVQVGAVKIYVAAVEVLRKKERQDETQFTTKIGGKNYFRSQLFRFVKFSFSVKRWIMPLLCRNWLFSTP